MENQDHLCRVKIGVRQQGGKTKWGKLSGPVKLIFGGAPLGGLTCKGLGDKVMTHNCGGNVWALHETSKHVMKLFFLDSKSVPEAVILARCFARQDKNRPTPEPIPDATLFVKPGDVYYWTSGWNCTTVTFVRITRVSKASVWCVSLKQESDGHAYVGGKCWPSAIQNDSGKTLGPFRFSLDRDQKPRFKTHDKNGTVSSYARPWDGNAVTWTPFMD